MFSCYVISSIEEISIIHQFYCFCRLNVLCDVVLVADNVEVSAHKTVLAGCSPYFYAMFTKFEERKLDRIVIQEIDSTALELLIEYVYTSEISVTEENVQVIN